MHFSTVRCLVSLSIHSYEWNVELVAYRLGIQIRQDLGHEIVDRCPLVRHVNVYYGEGFCLWFYP
jgi:hypothetical protein